MNGGQPDPIRRIVVGVDGSDHAMRAVVWSARLARATGAEVIAAHAIESPVFLDGFPLVTGTIPAESWDVAWKEWREHTRELLEQRWCRPLAAARVRYRADLIAGGPKALIEFAGSEEADVIVVGRRGRGGFAELVLGSFSHHLVHHSHTPVIVVPSAQD
jgi:nucleotide-binding universal stress UspA family protein